MKKLLLLLIFVIVALDVLSQTNSVYSRDLDVVIPSERNKKHLNFLKDKYDVPSVSNMYDCSSMHGKSFDNMFVGFNYAYMSDPQHSFGLTIGQVERVGWFFSAMTGLGNQAFRAEIECDERGFVDNEMQYYSGNVSNSRYSFIGGVMIRVAEPFALKLGAGYGAEALAWETYNGKWIRNSYYSHKGIEFDVGLQVLIKSVNLSFDVISNSFNTLELKLGLGVNIHK